MTVRTGRGALNGICPYFTMFPLSFPHDILERHASPGDLVLDPFSGRGTTNYACRLLGLPSIGIDSSPIAAALTGAKLANVSAASIMKAAYSLLDEVTHPVDVPEGEFWELAYHRDVLPILCRMREALLWNCRSSGRVALRAIILGALHGPAPKTKQSYFSNQSPRTYAPKPAYAVRYWRQNALRPNSVNVLEIIKERAKRYYGAERHARGRAIQGDSRIAKPFEKIGSRGSVDWVITSPPYYGVKTYIPDQWLRNWFVGGKPSVDYSSAGQLSHAAPEVFAEDLRNVWRRVGAVAASGARMVVRFGAINDRKVDAGSLLKSSLGDTGWKVITVRSAGTASSGKRQADHFGRRLNRALEEFDVWARWEG